MPRDRNKKDPLDEPDDLLAPEEDPKEDPGPAEPDATQFDDEPDEHETAPLHGEDALDDEAEPPASDVSEDDGLLAPGCLRRGHERSLAQQHPDDKTDRRAGHEASETIHGRTDQRTEQEPDPGHRESS